MCYIDFTDRHTLLIVLRVNNGRFELSGCNCAVEQNITLAVRAVLELWEEEEGHNEADGSSTTPDVTALSRQVPSCWVEHLRGKIYHRNLGDIVRGTADTGAQGAKANG